ncbi:MAG: hypothetical protein ABI810_18540 [Sphingomonas bacterium]
MKRFTWQQALLPVAVLTLAGCATDIMRRYVGRGPEAVMARYGPPDNVYALPDGRRAYQWMQISESTSPGSEETRTRWRKGRDGSPFEPVTTTQINPPTNETHRCFYTMYARREGAAWVFDAFERPEPGC